MIKKWVQVTFEKEGIHCYPAALTDPKLKDVSFLGHPHRHMFKFTVRLQVFHNERDVEFILLKRELQGLFKEDEPMQWEGMSCESLAEDILEYIKASYGFRDCEIEVSEDGENAAILQYHRGY
jgi:hypothetical protein